MGGDIRELYKQLFSAYQQYSYSARCIRLYVKISVATVKVISEKLCEDIRNM